MAEQPVLPPTYKAKAFPITPQQAQQILRDANRGEGWATTDRPMVVEETELKTSISGETKEMPTGRYKLTVKGPNQTNQVIFLRQGAARTVDTVGGPIRQEDWIVEEAPETVPKPTAANVETQKDDEGNVYERGADGQWHVVIKGGGGAAVKTALSQAELDDMKQNEAAGRGFMTTVDYQRLANEAARTGISADDLKEKRRQFSLDNERQWATERRLGTTAAAQNALTAAQTTGTGVETAINEERLKQLIAAAPDEATKRALGNELTRLTMDKTRQEMKQPSVQNLGTDATYGLITPEGTVEERMRTGYVPKTMGEIAARTGQLDALARQKGQELEAKRAANPQGYSADQAFADFNKWYDAQIQPQLGMLDAATQEAQYARGKEIAQQRQLNLTSALAAGNQAIARFNASSGEGLDPELAKYHKSMGTGKMPTDVDPSKMFAGGDLEGKVARQTAEALKYIDPQAAAIAGTQAIPFAQMNPRDVLNRTAYMGAAPPPAAAPAAAPVTAGGGPPPTPEVAATATNPNWYAEWQARQGADAGLQMRQAEAQAAWDAANAPPAEELPPVPEAAIPAYQPQQRRPAPAPVQRGAPPLLQAPVGNLDMDFAPGSLPTPAPVGNLDMEFAPGSLPTPYASTDYMSMIPPQPFDYVPPAYVPPNPVIAAAQAAYRRVPRTNWR